MQVGDLHNADTFSSVFFYKHTDKVFQVYQIHLRCIKQFITEAFCRDFQGNCNQFHTRVARHRICDRMEAFLAWRCTPSVMNGDSRKKSDVLGEGQCHVRKLGT